MSLSNPRLKNINFKFDLNMISQSMIDKYGAAGSDSLNSFFEECVKNSKYDKVKVLMDNFYNKLYPQKIAYSLFTACIGDDTRMFKYFMFKQTRFDFNTTAYWNESLVNSCNGSANTKMLAFILKSPLNKSSLSEEIFHTAFLNTNLKSLQLLIEKNKINVYEAIYKNNSEYLHKLIAYSHIDIIEYLAYKYEVSFVPFKETTLARAQKKQYNADKVLQIINKQELFFNLKETLVDTDTKIKNNKI